DSRWNSTKLSQQEGISRFTNHAVLGTIDLLLVPATNPPTFVDSTAHCPTVVGHPLRRRPAEDVVDTVSERSLPFDASSDLPIRRRNGRAALLGFFAGIIGDCSRPGMHNYCWLSGGIF